MTNQCVKGKRVERDLANWLKDKGCSSARRSAQHCGLPTDGATGEVDNSDIIAPGELPNWHIESKATKAPKIPPSKLKSWVQQIKADCPVGKLAVILNVANGYNPVAIMTDDVYRAVAKQCSSLTISTDSSFSPAIDLNKLETGARIYQRLIQAKESGFYGAVAFEADKDIIVVAVEAGLWLSWALGYEEGLKNLKEGLKAELPAETEAVDPRPVLERIK